MLWKVVYRVALSKSTRSSRSNTSWWISLLSSTSLLKWLVAGCGSLSRPCIMCTCMSEEYRFNALGRIWIWLFKDLVYRGWSGFCIPEWRFDLKTMMEIRRLWKQDSTKVLQESVRTGHFDCTRCVPREWNQNPGPNFRFSKKLTVKKKKKSPHHIIGTCGSLLLPGG